MLAEDFHYSLKNKKTELKICVDVVLHIFPTHAIVP